LKIKLAKTAGFCMGVHRAVEIVLDVVNGHDGPIYTFGPLIHNPQVLEILREKGVVVLDEPCAAKPGKVVIRAHGVPPQKKEELKAAGFAVIDATCPRVIKVQNIIAMYTKKGYAAIIVGDADHAEVVGLLGYARGLGYVVHHPDDVARLPQFDKAILVAQTTQDGKRFADVARSVRARFPDARVFNTICDSTHNRQAEVRELAKTVDAIVVVGGRESGNTRRLVQVAEQEGVPAFHVENESEIDIDAMASVGAVGVTAGASTPNWVLKKVYRALEALPQKKRGGVRTAIFRLQRWLLLSNTYLALGAGCLSYTCALLSGIAPTLASALMATCYVLSMHILNNFIGKEAVRYNDPDRAQFYDYHKGFLLTLAVVSGAMGLFMAFTLGIVPFTVLAVISVLGLLYAVKLTPGPARIGGKIQRLSDIPGSKTVLIALAWGVVTVVLPHLSLSLRVTTTMVFVTLLAAVMAFVRTAFFDILDMQGDRIVGQGSLPILVGEKKSLRLLKQLLVVFFAILLFAPMMHLTTTLAYGLTLSVFYMASVVQAFEKHWVVPGVRFEFFVETIFLFTAAVSLVWRSFHFE
jgi:(E)-4-hydroxy-3-methyl-but-2-enyl pyrophosphate reductase